MGQDEVIWELEPHTKAKHEILRNYLGAWFPILASGHSKVVYVDGFAGPGEYTRGEDGSPIIALKVAKDHVLKAHFKDELLFLFIESESPRAEHLKKKIAALNLPANFKYRVRTSDFETHITEVLRGITERGKNLAPSFFFIDPFGPSGFSLSLMKKISEQPSSEALINFSYQSLNRWFLTVESKHASVDTLFGNDRWRKALAIGDTTRKEEYLRRTYQESLEELGWKVRPFCMINRYNQTQYYLFFATKSPKGMLLMKRAMWKASPNGEFSYSDLSNPALPGMFGDFFEQQHVSDSRTLCTTLIGTQQSSKRSCWRRWRGTRCVTRHT